MPFPLPDLIAQRRYHAYNDWVKKHYGGRIQKISLDAGFTCPNRDGQKGTGGCSFCNNDGFTPSYLREKRNLIDQIDTGIAFMQRRYPNTQKFIAYFQSYTNTYAHIDELIRLYETALSHPLISGLAIGTRPDCLPDNILSYLSELSQTTTIELEIGIESCSDTVLSSCNRGHSFAESQDAVRRAASYELFTTGHLLLGLPNETQESITLGAQALAQLPLDAIKFHQLQIVRNTQLASQYLEDPTRVPLLSPDQYLDWVSIMLEQLPLSIKIQRLGSEVPPQERISPDWGLRLSRFPEKLTEKLKQKETWQARCCVFAPKS